MESERLMSGGYTKAEKALAGNYAGGVVVAFRCPYKRIGVGKGDKRRVVGVDHGNRFLLIHESPLTDALFLLVSKSDEVTKGDKRRVVGVDHGNRFVVLDDGEGGRVAWKPVEIDGCRGGTEVDRAEEIGVRAGNNIRWTRNDADLGLVNSRTAGVLSVANGRQTFQLEDGNKREPGCRASQLRDLYHAWASTVHASQVRTIENVIGAMEARDPHLTTQKSFYVEISRARDRAELVTDDATELRTSFRSSPASASWGSKE